LHNFRELQVWQKGIRLCRTIYEASAQFPPTEKFGLASQMQRCALSIPSNIAEGCGRNGSKELKHFLSIALGSSYELETQVILAADFGYINHEKTETILAQLQEIQKMISGLQKSLH
jgi:four helix bundle protein